MWIYSRREKTNNLLCSIISSLLIGLSFVLLFSAKLRLNWDFGAGSIKESMVSVWNSASETLGSFDYVLLPKYQLSSGVEAASTIGHGMFLLVFLLVITVSAFFAIRSRFKTAVLLFLAIEIAFSIISSVEISSWYYAFSILSIAFAMIFMNTERTWTSVLGTGVIALALLISSGLTDGFSDGNTFDNLNINDLSKSIQNKYYGYDPLGHGDLKKRNRSDEGAAALKVTMSEAHPMYLKGFIGSRFDGREWNDLSNSAYYKDADLIKSLDDSGFNMTGQLGQAAMLAFNDKSYNENVEGSNDELNDKPNDTSYENERTIEINNISADSRYVFVPYDITAKGVLEGLSVKGGTEFYPGKNRSIKKYSYSAFVNTPERWTDISGKFFEKALGSNDESISDYLKKESYFNSFIYKNCTYVGLKERELLAANIGSPGDQSQGHLDYKLAINSIRKYLEDSFVYSENLGDKKTTGKNELEEFFVSRKGFDVHYATLATLMFRYYGIPARYVEGYLVTQDDISNAKENQSLNGSEVDGTDHSKRSVTIDVPRNRAHAWTEIYIDGIGFVPLEVTPEYYSLMNEADMNIGISNESLVKEYEKEYGNKNDEEEDEEESETVGGENKVLKYIWYLGLALLIIVSIIALFYILKKVFDALAVYLNRRRLFLKEEPKLAVSAMYGYMDEKNYYLDDDTINLGNKAAYSLEEITEDERQEMLRKLKECKRNEKKGKDVVLMKDKMSAAALSKFSSLVLVLFISTFLFLGAAFSLTACSNEKENDYKLPDDLGSVKRETVKFLTETVTDPTVSGVGGDWLIFVLKRSGEDIPESYYSNYYDNVRALVKSKKGVLTEDKYTEYERLIIGLSAIGENPKDVEGYDLTHYVDDYDKVTAQGINASWYALMASKMGGFDLENEERYLENIKRSIREKEYPGAGLSDYLSIGLQTLSFYDYQTDTKQLIDEGIEELSRYQNEDGSLGNCESTAMCIIALAMNGVDPLKDERFIKDGNTLGDGLMLYYLGDGSFCHTVDLQRPDLMTSDLMATEQALGAISSIYLFDKGEKLYQVNN